LVKGVANAELDLEMAMDDEERQAIETAKASKTWRAVRIASRSRLRQLDKISDGKSLQALVDGSDSNVSAPHEREESSTVAANGQMETKVADGSNGVEGVPDQARPGVQTAVAAALDAVVEGR
jgi:THO complex subunit 1